MLQEGSDRGGVLTNSETFEKVGVQQSFVFGRDGGKHGVEFFLEFGSKVGWGWQAYQHYGQVAFGQQRDYAVKVFARR